MMLARKRSGYEGHDIHAVTGKHGDVRMVLEHSCGGISGFRLNHEIAAALPPMLNGLSAYTPLVGNHPRSP